MAVSREEIQAALTRAGRYFEAVQMDMDRLHDEAERRLEQAARSSRVDGMSQSTLDATQEAAPPASQEASSQRSLTTEHPQADGNNPRPLPIADAEALPIVPFASAEEQASAPDDVLTPAVVPSVDSARVLTTATLATPATADGAGVPDSCAPTFGEFLEQQLLPLYVTDIPFKYLRHLTERYCGVPMDSDDEEKAWKALGGRQDGRAAPAASQRDAKAQQGRRQRRRSRSARRESVEEPALDLLAIVEREDQPSAIVSQSPRGQRRGSTTPAGGSLGRLLVQASGKDGSACPPPLRAQMLNSIVEKRRKDRAAPRDMALGGKVPGRAGVSAEGMPPPPAPFTPRTAASGAAAPGTPLVSMALLASPMPPQSPWATAPSPVSMRSRIPRHAELLAPSPAPRTPQWGLLDTPGRPGRR